MLNSALPSPSETSIPVDITLRLLELDRLLVVHAVADAASISGGGKQLISGTYSYHAAAGLVGTSLISWPLPPQCRGQRHFLVAEWGVMLKDGTSTIGDSFMLFVQHPVLVESAAACVAYSQLLVEVWSILSQMHHFTRKSIDDSADWGNGHNSNVADSSAIIDWMAQGFE